MVSRWIESISHGVSLTCDCDTGAPDPTKSDLHCVLPTDTNSTSDLLNLASLIFDLVSAPDAALSIQKCTTLWAVFGYVRAEVVTVPLCCDHWLFTYAGRE